MSPLLISTINHRDWLLQTLVNYKINLKLAKITLQDESTNQPKLQAENAFRLVLTSENNSDKQTSHCHMMNDI